MTESVDQNGFNAPGDAGAESLAEKRKNRMKLKSDDEVEKLLEILESEAML